MHRKHVETMHEHGEGESKKSLRYRHDERDTIIQLRCGRHDVDAWKDGWCGDDSMKRWKDEVKNEVSFVTLKEWTNERMLTKLGGWLSTGPWMKQCTSSPSSSTRAFLNLASHSLLPPFCTACLPRGNTNRICTGPFNAQIEPQSWTPHG